MAPRSGKTTALAIPHVLHAPGPVVATANKADLWASTGELRAADTGQRVWAFDPQRIARGPRSWWWDPIGDLGNVEDAERLASHFVLTVEDDRAKDIWGPAAQELLAALLMAAKVSGADLTAVYQWLNQESVPTPADLLRPRYPALAASLRGAMDAPAETRGSVYFTARTAAKCLRNPEITRWVTPPASGLDRFDPDAFVRSRQTLYLLSKDGGGSAAPLVAALTDRVLRAAVSAAEADGGRLDPPLVAVLDEAANICRIGDLPVLYSHLGSRGVIPVTILQSFAQGVGVWGCGGSPARRRCGARPPSNSSGPAWTTRASPRTCPASSASTTCRPRPTPTVTAGPAAPGPPGGNASSAPRRSGRYPRAPPCCCPPVPGRR